MLDRPPDPDDSAVGCASGRWSGACAPTVKSDNNHHQESRARERSMDERRQSGIDAGSRVKPSVEAFADQAAAWLAERLRTLPAADHQWGQGSDDVSIFHNLSYEEERQLLDRAMSWQQTKCDAGYGAITWPEEFGGA